jgi:hypothetical protein
MSRTLSAVALSGGVALAAWAVTELVTSRLTDLKGLDALNAMVVAIPNALVVILIAPLIAGVIAGLVSGTFTGALGSVAAYLGVMFAASRLEGDPIQPVSAYLLPAVELGVLVLAGHLTGVAVRPRLRPA